MLAPGIVIAGKYRLERQLAQGGMGAVWAAFDMRLEVPVAVKFMAPALAASAALVGRFEREAKWAAQLRSPHVVQVFEHGVDCGMPFMVMELLDGEDLGMRLRRQGRLGLSEAAVIVEHVCKALRKAHDAGLVHRDLKPGNIFLARHDEDEVAKVLDFGIAKSQEPAARGDGTRTGVIMGSPSYMSPEQVRSTKGVDHRSDLWSLGLVMFRALTGRMAFVGETDADAMIRLCSDPIPVPSTIAPDLPREVDEWFARALVRDPAGRFQSAREMAAAFGKIVGRVPSSFEPAITTHAHALAPHERAVALVASDATKTLELGSRMAGVHESTMQLTGGAMRATAPMPLAAAAPVGTTLTSAGSVVAPPRVPGARRGRVAWGLGAAAVLGAIGTVAALGMRGAPRGVAAVSAPASASATAMLGPTATAEPAPLATSLDAGTAETGAPVPSASVAVVPSSAPPAPPVAPKPPAPSRNQAAHPAVGGLLDVPRVISDKK